MELDVMNENKQKLEVWAGSWSMVRWLAQGDGWLFVQFRKESGYFRK